MVTSAAVLTHRRTADTADAVAELVATSRQAGVTLRVPRDEADKHGLEASPGLEVTPELLVAGPGANRVPGEPVQLATLPPLRLVLPGRAAQCRTSRIPTHLHAV